MTQTLLILAGGTGGHIMPGLAVARVMQRRGWNIRWLGTRHGMENTLVPKAGLTLDTIEFTGLRGKGVVHALRGALLLVRGIAQTFRLVGSIRPAAVLGMGGYVTVPAGVSAALRGRPLILVNSDATLLLSNRTLAPFARRVLFGLPGDSAALGAKARWTGCPVREEIAAIPPPALRLAGRSGRLSLLVIGGSLGAAVLNRTVPEALARLPADARPTVLHQAGETHREGLQERYASLGVAAEIVAFIDDMAASYQAADLVICRAGAITVSELTAAGVASVLVPLVASTTEHQRHNAQYLEKAGAAIHLPQSELNADRLAELLVSLSRAHLASMAEHARALGRPRATEAVADAIEEVAIGPVASEDACT